jgi:hypothetical protein
MQGFELTVRVPEAVGDGVELGDFGRVGSDSGDDGFRWHLWPLESGRGTGVYGTIFCRVFGCKTASNE